MKSAGRKKELVSSADEAEKIRRIEESVCSVISSVLRPAGGNDPLEIHRGNEHGTAAFTTTTTTLGRNSGQELNNDLFSPTIISQHKSLANSLPSLSGVMVDSSLFTLSNAPVRPSMNICGPNTSATTTTSTRSSRHLQLVGDLPENVLETSCTPPSSPLKPAIGHQPLQQQQHPHNSSAGPVLASLAPVNMGIESSTSGTPLPVFESNFASAVAEDPVHRQAAFSSSSGTVYLSSNNAAALAQLFPMSTASGSVMPSAYLAVKVEPQDIVYSIASPTKGDGTTGPCAPTILSPLQFSIAPGSIVSPNSATFAAPSTTDGSESMVGSTLNTAGSNAEFLSLQPAALYVQPVQQNGQMQYVRVELPATISLAPSGTVSSNTTGKPSSNVSTVELAHNIIATMFQQQQQPTVSMPTVSLQCNNVEVSRDTLDQITPGTIVTVPSNAIAADGMNSKPASSAVTFTIAADPSSTTVQQRIVPCGITVTPTVTHEQPQTAPASVASRKKTNSSASQTRAQNSTSVEAAIGESQSGEEEGEEIYIDTKELCNRIAYELKAHSIPQAVFAERVLCRSQGTLSDLLRNPKPWNKLKSGRETFRRMYVWLKQPVEERLASLELWKGVKRKPSDTGDGNQATEPSGDESIEEISENACYETGMIVSPQRTDEPVASTSDQHSAPVTSAPVVNEQGSPQRRIIKKPRLVFTDIQKRTLQAIFKETQRPSREMQQTIAEHLNLDLSTVQNFFMNARRRSRSDQPDGGDSPTPFQQVRPITPPPATGASPSIDMDGDDDDGNGVTVVPTASLPTAVSFSKSKPKRPNRRPGKKRQPGSTDGDKSAEVVSSTDGIIDSTSLVYSGLTSSVTNPMQPVQHDESMNGTDERVLDEQNGADHGTVYMEVTQNNDTVLADDDDGVVNILQYGSYPSPAGDVGTDSCVTAHSVVITPSSMEDNKRDTAYQ